MAKKVDIEELKSKLRFGVKVWLEFQSEEKKENILGSGWARLLDIISKTDNCSLTFASQECKYSYKYAWNILKRIEERTKNCGAEIVGYLKTGSAYYSPASSIVEMVEAIAKDSKRIIPASVYLEGEYGYSDIFLGVPIKLGKKGVEKIIEIKLSSEAQKALDKSAAVTKENIKSV